MRVRTTGPTREERSAVSRPTDLVIPLFGLRCGSCALRTRRKIEALPGVVKASVSVPRERAIVSYFPQHTAPSEIMSVVESAGFDARVTRVRLSLVDPRFALTSPRALRDALSAQKGVVASSVDLTSEEVIVDYLPEETGPDRIALRMREAGFEMKPMTEDRREGESWLAITIVSLLFALAGTILSLKVGALDSPSQITGPARTWLTDTIAPLSSVPASSLDLLSVILAVLTLAIGARSTFVNSWRSLARRRVDGNTLAALAMLTLTAFAVACLLRQSPSAGAATAAMWLLAILHGGKLLQGRLKRRPRTGDSEPIECGQPLSNAEQRSQQLSAAAAPLTLLAAVAAAAAWVFVAGANHVLTAIAAFASVLVAVSATSFHLGVAAAIASAMERAAARGMRFLSGRSVERIHDISDIVVLETALPAANLVTDFVLVKGTSVDELLAYAMTVGAASDIAGIDAIFARGAGVAPHETGRVERPESGIAVAILDGTKVTVGKPGLVRARHVDTAAIDEEIALYSSLGRAPVVVAVGSHVVGAIVVGREITPEAREAVQKLRSLGHAVWLATREEPEVARALTSILDIDGVMSQPDRSKWWQELRGVGRKDGRVAIVGDPAHDEDLLVKADRSFAVGKNESGADARVAGGLAGIAGAIELADAAMRRASSNLRYALLYNVAATVIAAGAIVPLTGLIPSPPLAAACMVVATLAIEWNGARVRG